MAGRKTSPSIETVGFQKNGLGANPARDEAADRHGRLGGRILRVGTSGTPNCVVYLGAIRNYVDGVRPGTRLPLDYNMTG